MAEFLWTDPEWSFQSLERVYKAIETIAIEELGLDTYPNQIEIITSEQMVDSYSSIGLPIFYHHWSFGKHFSRNWDMYQKGMQGLAYEIVINSNPCISYLMEENTMTMQALVIAHACFGHNCFDEETELLTIDGWKSRSEIRNTDLVATMNRVTLRVEYHPIDRKFEYDYDGEMCHFESSAMDHLVTPNHKMIYVSGTGVFRECEAKDWIQTGTSAIVSGILENEVDDLGYTDDELRLLVWCMADGSLEHQGRQSNYWRFHLKKERKIERLSLLLDRLTKTFRRAPTKTESTKISVNLDTRFQKNIPTSLRLSSRQFAIAIEEYLHTDGSFQSKDIDKARLSGQIFTTSKYQVDKIQELAAICGAKSCYRISDKGVYSINIRVGVCSVQQSASPLKSMVPYKGKVWCVSVKNHTLFARRRGHVLVTGNSFFKHNALFREWTDAASIIDYLVFAKDYISKIEVRESRDVVEAFLDSCHALMNHGVNRYKRPAKLSAEKERKRVEVRDKYKATQVNELFDTLLKQAEESPDKVKNFPPEPEENLLYFCEKYAPDLPEWKREILRIVRKISQYFYPQSQTRLMNEGTASYCHYRIINRLHEKGLMTDGSYLEFLTSHTNVVFQPEFDDRRYSGINPYALGFAMMQDIERICTDPTDEDRQWFPDIAGCGDGMAVLRDAWVNYRDESFIRQFLSPKVIRDFGLFRIADIKANPHYVVTAIHDDRGYEEVRHSLADTYERHASIPQIEVIKLDPKTRNLSLRYCKYRDRSLDKTSTMLKHVEAIWGNACFLYDEAGNLIS